MNEFMIDGMTLVGTGYEKDVETFRHVYEGHDYDHGLQDLEAPATILDIGASLGGFTLSMMKRFPKARIVAVEANPYVTGCLIRNIQSGPNPGLVTVLNRAVDANARSGMDVVLTNTEGSTTGGSILPRPEWEKHPAWDQYVRKPTCVVRTVGISELLTNYELMPTVLKLDCEGSEISILEDLRDGGRLQWIDRIVGEWHGFGNRHLVEEILIRTHEVSITRSQGMPIGLFRARRRR